MGPFSVKKHKTLILILVAVALSYVARLFIQRTFPSGGSTIELVRKLDSSNRDTVLTGFHYLTERADPVAIPRALELLRSADEYIWLNAAEYLGACKHQDAVPYLIKALRHTAWRADADTAQYLRTITGADFGTDFSEWRQWWLANHPDFSFDWESDLGYAPRLTKTK